MTDVHDNIELENPNSVPEHTQEVVGPEIPEPTVQTPDKDGIESKIQARLARQERQLRREFDQRIRDVEERTARPQVGAGDEQDPVLFIKNIVKEAFNEDRLTHHQQAQQQEAERVQQDFESKLQVAANKYSDFEGEIAKVANKGEWSPAVVEAAQISHQNNAEVLYYLAKNEHERRRINLLPAYEQKREVLKLANNLQHRQPEKSSAPVPLSSKAPKSGASDSGKSYEAIKAETLAKAERIYGNK